MQNRDGFNCGLAIAMVLMSFVVWVCALYGKVSELEQSLKECQGNVEYQRQRSEVAPIVLQNLKDCQEANKSCSDTVRDCIAQQDGCRRFQPIPCGIKP